MPVKTQASRSILIGVVARYRLVTILRGLTEMVARNVSGDEKAIWLDLATVKNHLGDFLGRRRFTIGKIRLDYYNVAQVRFNLTESLKARNRTKIVKLWFRLLALAPTSITSI